MLWAFLLLLTKSLYAAANTPSHPQGHCLTCSLPPRHAHPRETQPWEWVPSLRPYHPECARSRLISEAKQGRDWLVLGWEQWVPDPESGTTSLGSHDGGLRLICAIEMHEACLSNAEKLAAPSRCFI